MTDKAKQQHPSIKQLKSFSPFNKQSENVLQKMVDKAVLRQLKPGEVLFTSGDQDNKTYYLVGGEVTMTRDGDEPLAISSISPQSIKALSNDKPRRATVTSVGRAVVIEMLDETLNLVSDSIKYDSYSVGDISITDEDDWMTRFLQWLDQLKLPVQNIQTVMANLQEIPVSKGTIIIKQGDIGDHYYILKQGLCKVFRQEKKGEKAKELLTLRPGDGFGEEALISDGIRNASVAMLSDGKLMRLSKTNFISQVVDPLLTNVLYREIEPRLGKDALLVDMRDAKEHARAKLKNTINIPYKELRKLAPTLDPDKFYIVYLDREHLKVTAFLMVHYGLNVAVLKDSFDDIINLVMGDDKGVPSLD